MPIFPDRPRPFTCAICGEHREYRWPGPVQCWPVEPVCRWCEQTFGSVVPAPGAFRDRRLLSVFSALAEALHTEAAHQHYRRHYGTA